MKRAIIDIGSNSVRLMIEGQNKKICVTSLGENLDKTGMLSNSAMERTANAVFEFANEAERAGICPEAFATEAVRAAKNGSEFCEILGKRVKVRVLSGEEEALCGFLGVAGKGGSATVLDIGGASTEYVVGKCGKIVYSNSLKIGIVRARDGYGENYSALRAKVGELVETAELPPCKNIIGIGGTATSLAGIDVALPYDPKNIHGRILSFARVCELSDMLGKMSLGEKQNLAGLHVSRADKIAGGAVILAEIMRLCGAESLTVSESDNIEGYMTLFSVSKDEKLC